MERGAHGGKTKMNPALAQEEMKMRMTSLDRLSDDFYWGDILEEDRIELLRKAILRVRKDFTMAVEGPTKSRIPRPTRNEIEQYARKLGFEIDGRAFLAHYDANGWTVGKNRPMKSWKGAVVTWTKSSNRGYNSTCRRISEHHKTDKSVNIGFQQTG